MYVTIYIENTRFEDLWLKGKMTHKVHLKYLKEKQLQNSAFFVNIFKQPWPTKKISPLQEHLLFPFVPGHTGEGVKAYTTSTIPPVSPVSQALDIAWSWNLYHWNTLTTHDDIRRKPPHQRTGVLITANFKKNLHYSGVPLWKSIALIAAEKLKTTLKTYNCLSAKSNLTTKSVISQA